MHRLSWQSSELIEARSLVSSRLAQLCTAPATAAAFAMWVPLVAASQKITKTGFVRTRRLI